MIPKNAIVRIASFSEPSDIRFRVLGYSAESDHYELESTVSKTRHTIERVLMHAYLRRKQFIKERPQS